MRSYYLFTLLLSVFVVGMIVLCFTTIGSPISQRDVQLDRTRMSAFSGISNGINTYYQKQGKLPPSLEDVKTENNYINFLDPETNQPYTYNVKDDMNYELCTTFSAASQKSGYMYDSVSQTHKKGYDCMRFMIPDYVRMNKPTPTILPTNTLPPTNAPKTVTPPKGGPPEKTKTPGKPL